MALQEPSVGLFGRITTDNTLPERDSEGADPQRELRNVRPNSLEKAMRSNQTSPRAHGPALLRTGASATSSCARLVSLDASAMGRHGALGRVDLGGCPPRSPTDPGLHITRTRFLIS